ncbi:hypothetical protein ACFL3V_06945 [Nanoarchaeota archaeon]
MKESVPFFRTIWLALNPWRYDEMSDRELGSISKYFFSFVFVAFVLAIVLMLPMIASFVNNQMSHFDVLEVKFNTSMNSAVVFPENDPYVTIDTREAEGKLKEGKYLITDEYLYRKAFITGKIKQEALGPYKDLAANEGMVVALLLLMAPSLLFLFYVSYTIKILLVVLLVSLISLVVTRVMKFEVDLVDTLKTGLLAATPMIIIDLVRLPFGVNVYFAQYIAFLIFFIVGIVKVGSFEGFRPKSIKPKRRKIRRSGKGKYIDMTKNI